jgi:FkbM family methyltransferase
MNSVKDMIRFALGRGPSEFDRLIRAAMKFPRYTLHEFTFRDFKLQVTDFLSVAYQIKEYFGDSRMDFNSDSKTPLIIDCGANVGISVLRAKQLFPAAKIMAFEPDQKVFACLEKNLSTNGITDVELIRKAVWTNNDGVNFGSEGADGGSVYYAENKNIVPSARLKDVLASVSHVDLLKIDIEGAEIDVLVDCKNELKKVKNLFVEYHSITSQSQRLHELLEILSSNSFRYYIHSIGTIHKKPFVEIEPGAMDIQLDIHAIRR